MKNYEVSANGHVYGVYKAFDAQDARDQVAQEAGYRDEDDLVQQLGRPSELQAIAIE